MKEEYLQIINDLKEKLMINEKKNIINDNEELEIIKKKKIYFKFIS